MKRSHINILNSNEARIEPWGTLNTGMIFKDFQSIYYRAIVFFGYLTMFGVILYCFQRVLFSHPLVSFQWNFAEKYKICKICNHQGTLISLIWFVPSVIRFNVTRNKKRPTNNTNLITAGLIILWVLFFFYPISGWKNLI